MFSFSRKPAFGLDLSDASFKLVQIKNRGGKLYLSSFIKEDIPSGWIGEGEIKKPEELAALVKKIIKKAKGEAIQTKRVVCNLPEEKVFIRVIQMPRMKKEEMDKAIRWEAEAHIPLGINEVYLDWQIVGPSVRDSRNYEVLLAAAPKKIVENYLVFLKASGLEPIALEPESVAVTRSLLSSDDLKPAIIVDLGTTGTNFVIFSDQSIRFTSHIHISGQFFNRAIMKELAVDEKEANQLKIKIGLDKTKGKGLVYKALEPIVNQLAEQIRDYIIFYQNQVAKVQEANGKIVQILLCGGDSLLSNLPAFLSQRLNLSVRVADPLVNLTVSDKKQLIYGKGLVFSKKEAFVYTTALGLALRDFV